jgi:hypothetical protein
LRFGAGTPPAKAGGKDPGIVQDHEVIGAKQLREIPKNSVFEGSRLAAHVKHARGGTVEQRLLRNLCLGQVVVEVGNEHAGRL